MNKAIQYNWAKPGDKGRHCEVPIAELLIDHSYQRGEVSEYNTLAISRGFNWVSCGSLIVMQRPDGKKYVVDGQQRLLSARNRGDIKTMPCLIFSSDGPEHEAVAFIALNVRRKTVPAVVKFSAKVMAGENPEKEISDWLKEHGLRVLGKANDNSIVDFPTALVRSWRIDEEMAKRALLAQVEVSGASTRMNSSIHKGLWWLLRRSVDVEAFVPSMKAYGLAGLMGAIRSVAIECGQDMSERICGLGILRVINHRRRNKVAVKEEVAP